MTHPLPQPSPNARQDAVQRGVDAYRENHARAGISVHRIIDRVLIAAGYDELTAAHAELVAEVARLRGALLECARLADALKRPCSDYPDSVQAVRNAQYANISAAAHIALGTIRGPELTLLQRAEAAERERDELRQQLGVLLDAINLDHGKSLESLGPVAAVESVLHRAKTWHRERRDTAQEIERLTAELARREEDRKKLARAMDALTWALGANGEFRRPRPMEGPYWWRGELAERACIYWNGKEYIHRPRAAIDRAAEGKSDG